MTLQDGRQAPGGQGILPALEPDNAAAAADQEKPGVPVDHRGRGPGGGKLVKREQAALVQVGPAGGLQGDGLLHEYPLLMGVILPHTGGAAKGEWDILRRKSCTKMACFTWTVQQKTHEFTE